MQGWIYVRGMYVCAVETRKPGPADVAVIMPDKAGVSWEMHLMSPDGSDQLIGTGPTPAKVAGL